MTEPVRETSLRKIPGPDNYCEDSVRGICVPCVQMVVRNAYFARASVIEETIGENSEYKIIKDDTLSGLALKFSTSVSKIKEDNGLIGNGIKEGGTLIFSKKTKRGEKISFAKSQGAMLGDEVYLIVETTNLRGKQLILTIHQGKNNLLSSRNEILKINNGSGSVLGTVSGFYNNTSYLNKGLYIDFLIAKVKLAPDTEVSKQEWNSLITASGDKKAHVYLKVQVAPADMLENVPIVYEGKPLSFEQNISNTWVNGEGEWFEVKASCDCGKKYRDLIQCTRYNEVYGPAYWGDTSLADYSYWDKLVKDKKVTEEEKDILVKMAENEGKLDSVQSYDSEIITVGAMQKTVNPKGKGEFPIQVQEFKAAYPDKYKELFECCGWTVENGTMYYQSPDGDSPKKITGLALKNKIREGFTAAKFRKMIKCKPLEPIIKAANDPDFQAKQVEDFIGRLRNKVLVIVPNGKDHTRALSDYLKSKLGKATALDHHINRPAYVQVDFGKALDNFYAKPEYNKVSKDPTSWKGKHEEYEKVILDDYGVIRRGTSMEKRYNALKTAFTSLK